MAPKFGTSGLRGLVTELTPTCVADHVGAFIASCDMGSGLFVGHDLRASSPDISDMVTEAARMRGIPVTQCGPVPTPALALAAMRDGAAAVMITGSHIPADRNGLKFYTPAGEITKEHEASIVAALGATTSGTMPAPVVQLGTVTQSYQDRYALAFADSLLGMRIGLYAHSAVGRDLMAALLTRLGAEVVALGRSDLFIPVDTEAVSASVRAQLKEWAAEHAVDAIISTDADGDRPLVADETGDIVVGDILGQITAASLGAATVVTPISSNTGVAQMGTFDEVIRTRIGSPYVIAGMAANPNRVVGYEANGGFLLGFDAAGPTGPLLALLTRDAALPILACLAAARDTSVSALVASQPPRFTAADRLQDVPTEQSASFVLGLRDDPTQRAAFLAPFGAAEEAVNTDDGLRMTLANGRIVHLRPSGNAPELRCYVEAETPVLADEMLSQGLAQLRSVFDGSTG
jgi:phosphomannomutase